MQYKLKEEKATGEWYWWMEWNDEMTIIIVDGWIDRWWNGGDVRFLGEWKRANLIW